MLPALTPNDKRADRLRYIDRRVIPGINKLTWDMDRTGLDFYQKEARKYCRDGAKYLGGFKSGLARIQTLCAQIADTLLITIERQKIVEHTVFADLQVTRPHTVKLTLSMTVHTPPAPRASLFECCC